MNQNKVLEKLTQIQNQIAQKAERPLSLNEATQYLNISKSTLYKLTHQSKIPHFKPNGKKIYFLKSDLNDWLLRNRVPTTTELEQKAIDYVSLRRKNG